MKMNFYSHANKTYFPKKGLELSLVLKVKVFGTRKWPTGQSFSSFNAMSAKSPKRYYGHCSALMKFV